MGANHSPLKCFKAYDIRGQVPYDLNLEIVRQVGLAFVAEVQPKTVAIGYDMRLSSEDMARVLASGVQDAGADVTMLGLCGTEEMYHAVFSQQFDGGIMVTASHNPADWNGLKLVREQARPLSQDTGLQTIHERILAGDLPIAVRRGTYVRKNFRDEYIQHLLSYLHKPDALKPRIIVANVGNGCAWLPVNELQKHLPCTLIPLNQTPDGTFPNGVPNPLLPENREDTRQAVLKHKADFGLAWDGDFDRCFFFDEKGTFIEGYYMVGLLADALLAANPGEKIIHDPRLVWNTVEMVKAAGGIPVETKAGHAFIKERMRLENALYGGEMSAHHYFREFSFCDSGMIVWLLVYELICLTGKPLSQLVEERMEAYPTSGEINRSLKDADAAITRIQETFAPSALAITYVDGLSMEFAEWRCNIRKSNTEPVLRLNVESRGDKSLMQARTQELLDLMY